jgi:hypothetical protein
MIAIDHFMKYQWYYHSSDHETPPANNRKRFKNISIEDAVIYYGSNEGDFDLDLINKKSKVMIDR